MIKTLHNVSHAPIATFVFAHGAGAGMDSEFMTHMAAGIASHSINVLRFNFPYMQLAEELGRRRPPDRADKLLACFKEVLAGDENSLPVFIGGKSMGGRMASMLLAESDALGCVCMGYPFHPPKKPETLRTEHFYSINKPVLILQGERDTFGTRQDIANYRLPNQVAVDYLTDGDHSFKPRKASGLTQEHNLNLAIKQTVKFIHSYTR